MIERLWVGPVVIRLARLLGSDWTPAVLNPPILPEHAARVYRTVVEHALRDFDCEAVSFSRLSGEFTAAADLRQACGLLGAGVVVIRDRATTVHTVWYLPGTFVAYLAGISRNERGAYRREERRLEECGRVRLAQISDPDEIGSAFERFVTLHHDQWSQTGKLGHFGDWPKSLAFTRDVLCVVASQERAAIAEISVGQAVVAMQLNFRFGRSAYWRLSARSPAPEWDRHGLGRVALVRQIEQAIASGVRRIEAGSGHYPYKLRLGGVEYPLYSILVACNQRWPRLKARLLAIYADVLNLLYYRIWFCRLAPRLPLPRRPLWKSWIRTRV